jgi:hypothetical protein
MPLPVSLYQETTPTTQFSTQKNNGLEATSKQNNTVKSIKASCEEDKGKHKAVANL